MTYTLAITTVSGVTLAVLTGWAGVALTRRSGGNQ